MKITTQDFITTEKTIRELYGLHDVVTIKDNVVYYIDIVEHPEHKNWGISRPQEREATEENLIGWTILNKLLSYFKPWSYEAFCNDTRIPYRKALAIAIGWEDAEYTEERNAKYLKGTC